MMYHNSSHIPTLMYARTSTHAILTTSNRLETHPAEALHGAYSVKVGRRGGWGGGVGGRDPNYARQTRQTRQTMKRNCICRLKIYAI